jgi:hypothetical protein
MFPSRRVCTRKNASIYRLQLTPAVVRSCDEVVDTFPRSLDDHQRNSLLVWSRFADISGFVDNRSQWINKMNYPLLPHKPALAFKRWNRKSSDSTPMFSYLITDNAECNHVRSPWSSSLVCGSRRTVANDQRSTSASKSVANTCDTLCSARDSIRSPWRHNFSCRVRIICTRRPSGNGEVRRDGS